MTRPRPIELDVRTLPPADRQAHIFAAFDGLQGGEAMVLVTDHDPHPLLYRLEVERPGDYNWSPLEEGPRCWRVRIDRRGPSHKRHRGVMEYLAWDHDRLDELLDAFRAHARAGAWRDAEARFQEFRHGLLRHIRLEEELLFPAFEARSGMPADAGPTAVMREEHRQIRGELSEIARLAAAGARGRPDLAASEAHVHAMLDVLVEHNVKEEQVLYPSIDSLLDEDERDDLVRRMMAVSA